MPQPDSRGVLVAGPLQNVSVAYFNRSYIAPRIFPRIGPVATKAKITLFLKGAWFRDEADVRGEGAESKRGAYPTGYLDVNCVERSFAREVTDEARNRAKQANSPPLRPDQNAIRFATDKVDLRKERITADMILNGTWCDLVGGEDAEGGWAAGDGNTFINDVETRIETIRSRTGFRPNVLMLSASTLSQLKQEDTILDRIKHTQRGVISAELIAALLGLDEILVGESIYSDAEETAAGDDFNAVDIWDKNSGQGSAFLFYRPAEPGLEIPSAGYMAWENLESGQARRVTTWREASKHQDVYEVAESLDIVQVDPDLGFLWYDTIQT